MKTRSEKPGDPYKSTPVLETPYFMLRLVRMEDAEDLLRCRADPKARPFFNAAGCTSDFCYRTRGEIEECLRFFLKSYRRRDFIPFALVEKESGRAAGFTPFSRAAPGREHYMGARRPVAACAARAKAV